MKLPVVDGCGGRGDGDWSRLVPEEEESGAVAERVRAGAGLT